MRNVRRRELLEACGHRETSEDVLSVDVDPERANIVD
jgi:hypothetical protein